MNHEYIRMHTVHIFTTEKHSNILYTDPHIHRFAVYLRLLFTSAHLSHSVEDQLSIGSHTATESLRFVNLNFFFEVCNNNWPKIESTSCHINDWITTFSLRSNWFETNIFNTIYIYWIECCPHIQNIIISFPTKWTVSTSTYNFLCRESSANAHIVTIHIIDFFLFMCAHARLRYIFFSSRIR